MPRSPVLLAAAASLAVALLAPRAHANGRFPGANQLVFRPGLSSSLVVRTTFGFLASDDAGATTRWICEEAVGYAGQQDPAIAIFGDGTLATAALEGAFASHDGGCTHASVESATSLDFTVSRADPTRGLLITSTFVKGVHEARVHQSVDAGHTFTLLAELDPALYPDTIDIAPSLPTRVYLSGTFATTGALAGSLDRSDDGGATWTRQTVDLGGDAGLFIAAVDPVDPNVVYARTTGKEADRLLVSKDGGATFTAIASATAPGGLLGFALSPDGSRVAIGGPSIGVRVASRESLEFAAASATPVACLTWVETGLHACGAGTEAGFSLAVSQDEGKTFTPLLGSLTGVCGPLSTCGAGSSFAATCPARWPAIAATFGGDGVDRCGSAGGAGGAIGGAGATSSNGGSGAPLGGAGGAGGAANVGGSAGASGADTSGAGAARDEGACGITIASGALGSTATTTFAFGLLVGSTIGRLARRRRRG